MGTPATLVLFTFSVAFGLVVLDSQTPEAIRQDCLNRCYNTQENCKCDCQSMYERCETANRQNPNMRSECMAGLRECERDCRNESTSCIEACNANSVLSAQEFTRTLQQEALDRCDDELDACLDRCADYRASTDDCSRRCRSDRRACGQRALDIVYVPPGSSYRALGTTTYVRPTYRDQVVVDRPAYRELLVPARDYYQPRTRVVYTDAPRTVIIDHHAPPNPEYVSRRSPITRFQESDPGEYRRAPEIMSPIPRSELRRRYYDPAPNCTRSAPPPPPPPRDDQAPQEEEQAPCQAPIPQQQQPTPAQCPPPQQQQQCPPQQQQQPQQQGQMQPPMFGSMFGNNDFFKGFFN
ncbi:hypothetical protein PAPYR_6232 [Paratrimastix pyriformis]|uniref:Uncharacterized protein n=1 Tax=Paratrimastix pyriformis TaxID=342808 RepID=A0ABQ8UFT5_9EUKA|nr:hypothetical protein PAPYR_6232 [Paratrimastix pyriformis]